MNWKLTTVCVILLAVFVLAAGCTGTDEPSGEATAVPTAQPTSSGDPNFSLTPGPVDEFSEGQAVTIQVIRDSNKPNVTVTFSGGKGREQIKDIKITFYREEDGAIETFSFGPQPRTGAEHVFIGSSVPTMKDRVKAVASYYNGDVLTVLDAVYEYKSRG